MSPATPRVGLETESRGFGAYHTTSEANTHTRLHKRPREPFRHASTAEISTPQGVIGKFIYRRAPGPSHSPTALHTSYDRPNDSFGNLSAVLSDTRAAHLPKTFFSAGIAQSRVSAKSSKMPSDHPSSSNDGGAEDVQATVAPSTTGAPTPQAMRFSLEESPAMAPLGASLQKERRIIFLVGAIQFVNVLDFMIVMPMGPDFADALGISTSHIGLVGGVYTAAAAVAGVSGSLFLDRFDRRQALTVAMLGLAVGTAVGGLATDLTSLLLARILAGCFGGPATSLSLAIVTDAVPPERRGKALGSVMAAFSLASILGVPAGLELSQRFGFRAPFFTLAAVGLIITGLSTRLLPTMRGHIGAHQKGFLPTFDRLTLLSLTNTALVMLGVFAVVPNLSAYVQHNMGYPREMLGMLYLVGGIASFIAMRIVGGLVDRVGAFPLVVIGTGFHVVALDFFFLHPLKFMPIFVIFTLYMLSGSVRMVPMQTLATQVPRAAQRARFMSAQSAVQHMASALGAFLGSVLLLAQPDGTLIGMDQIAGGSLVVALIVPFLILGLEKGLRARQQATTQPASAA